MLSSDDPASWAALKACVAALRPVAEFKLDPAIDQKMLFGRSALAETQGIS